MRLSFLLFAIIGIMGFYVIQNSQNQKEPYSMINSFEENQNMTNLNYWLAENSNGNSLSSLESGCVSYVNPPPPCACPLPDGGCIRVEPTAICYDGTLPFCP
ncbi:MAG TPA: hypothetical protein VKX40_06925 [Aequorivita sp.]|nr:hypothetical protein [Aequorivita sp.]